MDFVLKLKLDVMTLINGHNFCYIQDSEGG